jgi:hypothetical protein
MGRSAHPQRCPTAVVCAGKDCRRHADFGALCDGLGDVAQVRYVGCLGLCHSPVAVVGPTSEQPVVLEKIRTRKQRRDLVAVIAGDGRLTGRLKALRASEADSRRAIRRLRRRLAA